MSLLTWVSDELHAVTGMSDKTIAAFFLELAATAKDQGDLLQKIRDTQTIDVDAKVEAFAANLLQRVPRKIPANSAGQDRQKINREKEEQAREMAQKKYQMLVSSEDEEAEALSVKVKKAKKAKKTKKKRTKSEDEGKYGHYSCLAKYRYGSLCNGKTNDWKENIHTLVQIKIEAKKLFKYLILSMFKVKFHDYCGP